MNKTKISVCGVLWMVLHVSTLWIIFACFTSYFLLLWSLELILPVSDFLIPSTKASVVKFLFLRSPKKPKHCRKLQKPCSFLSQTTTLLATILELPHGVMRFLSASNDVWDLLRNSFIEKNNSWIPDFTEVKNKMWGMWSNSKSRYNHKWTKCYINSVLVKTIHWILTRTGPHRGRHGCCVVAHISRNKSKTWPG